MILNRALGGLPPASGWGEAPDPLYFRRKGRFGGDSLRAGRGAAAPTGALLLLLLAGCTVGPDFTRPPSPAATGYGLLPAETVRTEGVGGGGQRLDFGRDLPAEWWTLFQSPPLNALIGRALAANPTLSAAQAALKAADEATAAQRGAYFPFVTAGFSAERQKTTSFNGATPTSPVINSQGFVYNTYTPQVSVSYTPDVWGANYRQVENLEAQADAQRFQLEATDLTLTATLVADAVTEASLRGQIAATRKIITLDEQALDILRKLYLVGTQPRAAVAAQEAQLAEDKQTLPALLKMLEQNRDALAALAGTTPDQGFDETFDLASLTLPQDLPVSLPSALVQQRPDIRQAEANVQAASANVGIAVAARLPQVTLSGGIASAAPFVAGGQGLFTPGSGNWSLTGSLLGTLFDGFGLLHKQRAAEALLDQAKDQYRATVIVAFQNVADALHAIERDAEGLEAAVNAEKAAADSLEITRRQLETGSANYLALITAQQAESRAILALVQAQAARYSDTAALFQALGGGWWIQPGTPGRKTADTAQSGSVIESRPSSIDR